MKIVIGKDAHVTVESKGNVPDGRIWLTVEGYSTEKGMLLTSREGYLLMSAIQVAICDSQEVAKD